MVMLLLVLSVFGSDYMQPGPKSKDKPFNPPTRHTLNQLTRPDTVDYVFSIPPMNLLMSYYDYMIGSYNDLPLCLEPLSAYSGYFLAFHGQRTASGQRRVFSGYIQSNGTLGHLNEITVTQNREGYPGIDIDPVSGKPIYAWHAQIDADEDLEVQMAWDIFLEGASGIMTDPVTIINNPTTVTPPGGTATTDNEFIWPTVQIGPSPTAGMRRIYVLCRNNTTHVTNPSENPKIAYADVDSSTLEIGTSTALTWNYISIPLMDSWNHDPAIWRRPFFAFTVGDDGRLYYLGYHFAVVLATDDEIFEPDLDAFVCDNYGQGTWQRITAPSRYNLYNPKTDFGSGVGYLQIPQDQVPPSPVPDDSVFCEITNSSHLNAAYDVINDKIHLPGMWATFYRGSEEGDISTYWFLVSQAMKDLVFDVNTNTFAIREIYPIAGTPTDTLKWMPWDQDGDWLPDDYYDDDPQSASYGDPVFYAAGWPFPYWDETVSEDGLYFHYTNTKITPPNAEGMMAAVWQDTYRSRLFNSYPADFPELAAFADTPEIFISCSEDFGVHWTEPISLNKVETPQLANMKPMWVYPADKMIYTGTVNGRKTGKLGLMFYDDLSWGAFYIDPPHGQNSGGYVRFMELAMTYPVANEEEIAPPAISYLRQNYPNPFNPETTISFVLPQKGFADLGIYNVKGQLVKTLVSSLLPGGEQKYVWNGTDDQGRKVASGLYFYKLTAYGHTETRKMMLLK